ncbi:hypothetical protein [Hymenobacter agri]
MHFHLPRRRRRRLLLPQGWVALAGLLLLGCLALHPWQEQLKRRSVLQLTMPPINKSGTIWPLAYFEDCDSLMRNEPKLTYASVDTYRHWHIITLGKGPGMDTLAIHDIERILHARGTRPNWNKSGLKVCFLPSAHYSSLILSLSLFNRYHVQQYFLDIKNKPIALYTLTVPKSECPPMPK